MDQVQLILSLPQGAITATSLGIDGYAWHRSPGSGKHYHGRSILVELATTPGGEPDFTFHDEGGWRDARADTISAIAEARGGKRTKTALSNNAFSATPVAAYRRLFLVKTGGQTLELEAARILATFTPSTCHEHMAPDEIADAIGLPRPRERRPRAYMIFCPTEFIVLSNLTPEEYVWYATHRPGKIFRQVIFTEIPVAEANGAAESVYDEAVKDLAGDRHKKTKTIVTGDSINRVPLQSWLGQGGDHQGGVYVGDPRHVQLWRFPAVIPHKWSHAGG
jgi:hypothetical protein